MIPPKHTKGPWKVQSAKRLQHGESVAFVWIIDVAGNELANVPDEVGICFEDDLQEALANAKLMAAAPDLIEALKGVLRAYDTVDELRIQPHPQDQASIDKARLLIAELS
jgi:hypothetical protein